MHELKMIKDSAQHVVSAISASMGVDVAVIDVEFNLVATSKTFLEQRGTVLNKNFIKQVFSMDTMILPNPGHNVLCKGCRYDGNCPETAEVGKTILYDGRVIGIIIMIAYTNLQREMLLSKPAAVLEFLGEMAILISSEIKLKQLLQQEKVITGHLETTIDCVDEGIITVDRHGIITQINLRAAKIMGLDKASALGSALAKFFEPELVDSIVRKGNRVSKRECITNRPTSAHVLLSANSVKVGGQSVGAVIAIEDFKDVRSLINHLSGQRARCTFDDIIGESTAIRKTKTYAKQVALHDASVLIQGESGTGKELFARAIHCHSERSAGPFVPINCAAVPESLLESELFGYEEGAFSGARKGGKQGKFELASGGTIFLDEIGDMPLHMQVKLLRVLQDKIIERVGGIKSFPVDVRIIASTNQNLDEMYANKMFREDLYFRLNVIPLHVPALRDRQEDIFALASFFLKKYSKKYNRCFEGFMQKAETCLTSYYWPGNVRELENAIEYAVNLETGERIADTNLPQNVRMGKRFHSEFESLESILKKHEKMILKEVLAAHGHTLEGKKAAARELRISLPTLYRKLKESNLR